ncbi:hypothetical protein [Paenibacillus sp. sgz500958]|uniref:hypothetical protein n=1 Tax=Paenibacillus sp. sgz500958 TaxID=3242475 RepID=UPI0036D36B86
MSEMYRVETRTATIEEYRKLCSSVGWKDFMNLDAAEVALSRSLFGVVVCYGDETVGMGRIVGDGQIFFTFRMSPLCRSIRVKGQAS